MATSVGKANSTIDIADPNNFYNDPSSIDPTCFTEETKVFVQWTCIQTDTQIYTKYQQLAKVETIAIFIALVFLLNLRRIYHKGEKDFTEYNLETVTAGDFTIEWDIEKKTYELWDVFRETREKEAHPEYSDISEGTAFKARIKQDIEKLMGRFSKYIERNKVDYEDDAKDVNIKEMRWLGEKVFKVADINFAYDNGLLIKILKKRGYAIECNDFAAMRNCNNELIEFLNKDENGELCKIPKAAFITFEYEEGRRMALHMSEK